MYTKTRRSLLWCRHAVLRHFGKPNGGDFPEFYDMMASLRSSPPEIFTKIRNLMLAYEANSSLGADLKLSEKEEHANCLIMREKRREYQRGIMQPHKFAPGYHIFRMLKFIENSKLFCLLKDMPKGGVLHAHDTALCSTGYLLELTHRDNLWICTKDEGCHAVGFRFSKDKPKQKLGEHCEWEPMAAFRERRGSEVVNKYLLKRFSMFPLASFRSNNEAWQHFMGIFILLDGLLCYAPVWGDYFYNALKEFHEDGVQYLELRSLLPLLYDENGKEMRINDTVSIYKTKLEEFKKDYPDFIDAKLIYAPLRSVTNHVMDEYIRTCVTLKKEFPDFLVGFDLVGQEELGRPLIDFLPQLLLMPKDIDFYFHAGETKWSGSQIDENLIDAVLLGTKRIGHGFAIAKHPVIMDMVKCLNIAVEVCPVSNQILQLGSDYRNHPAAVLIAANVPMVISSDDPSFWRATPLSHDFYMAFLGIAAQKADLRLLKKLAGNSIKYSALNPTEKDAAYVKWKQQWNKYIDKVIEASD